MESKKAAASFRYRLETHGLKQAQFARRIGVNVTTVNRWANGKAEPAKYATAYLDLLSECVVLRARVEHLTKQETEAA